MVVVRHILFTLLRIGVERFSNEATNIVDNERSLPSTSPPSFEYDDSHNVHCGTGGACSPTDEAESKAEFRKGGQS
jgi:hypothetical protein